jgi:hypothetical protein
MHVDMMKSDDSKQQQADAATSDDDMQVVSPCVQTHCAPASDDIGGADEKANAPMLGYK